MSLFPKEHGAYGQLIVPLVTSLAVAGVTTPALLIGLAAVAGFLAHEPLLVLLGRRGHRARRDEGLRAAVWVAVCGSATVGAGTAAVWSVPASVRWSFLLPLLPIAILTVALAARREKSAEGEIAVALAFSFVGVPICLAAGASIVTALSVGIAFASIFVTATLAVRVIVLKIRGGGSPWAARATRWGALALAATLGVGLFLAAARALLPWPTLAAVVPGLLAAVSLILYPPRPTRLRTVGWTLISTSLAAALILIAGL